MTTPTVVCVGECMLELRPTADGTFALDFAGDTYNTAVYLRRVARELGLDVDVAYLTGVGDDHYSALMRRAWAGEGVRDLATVVPGGRPGLYAIENGDDGERRFVYWRSDSAALRALRRRAWLGHLDADVVYLSAITLQLLTPAVRMRLCSRLQELRRTRRTVVALDTNYRAAGWASPAVAAAAVDEVVRCADVVFATLDDEIALHGPMNGAGAAARLARLGPQEVVVKDGANGSLLRSEGRLHRLGAGRCPRVLDTTAAGDSFAGAYLAARLGGASPLTSARTATAVAAVVIGHRGAITPREVALLR